MSTTPPPPPAAAAPSPSTTPPQPPPLPPPLSGNGGTGGQGGGGSSTAVGVGGATPPSKDGIPEGFIQDGRILAGFLTMGAAVVCAVLFMRRVFDELPTMEDAGFVDPDQAPLAAGVLLVHAVATVAGIYFFYQVLRAGERMAMPLWVLRPHRYLGVGTPVGEMKRMTQWLLKQVKPFVPTASSSKKE